MSVGDKRSFVLTYPLSQQPNTCVALSVHEFAMGSSSIFIPQFTTRKPEKVLLIFLIFNQSKPKKKDLEPSLLQNTIEPNIGF
jgi:hypothetical protein